MTNEQVTSNPTMNMNNSCPSLRQFLALLAILAGTVLFNGCVCQSPILHASSPPKKDPLDFFDGEERLPILAWWSVVAEEATLERYQELKDCGFNLSFGYIDTWDRAMKALDYAEAVGIKIIFMGNDLEKNPTETARKVKYRPGLAGYFLRDEPHSNMFPELGEYARKILEGDPNHLLYLNLLPIGATDSFMPYRDYIRNFVKAVPVQLLSFDHYPIVIDYIRPTWYENLEIFAEEAKRANKPFWAFALATNHGPYPVPTIAMLKLQMYSNLAYGAQGVQYFTYWNRGEDTHPITNNRKLSPVWDRLREVNHELQARAYAFVGSEVVWVRHLGKDIPQGTKRLEQLPKIVKRLETGDKGAVVSLLEKRQRQYLVVVNRSFTEQLNLTIDFQPDSKVDRIRKDGTKLSAHKYFNTYWMEPGSCEIFAWDKND